MKKYDNSINDLTALKNALIFVGNGDIIENSSVIIQEDKILGIETDIPSGCREIDLSGCMLFPGFIDCHVHLCLDGRPDSGSLYLRETHAGIALMASSHARKTLLAGVTTVRDLGGINYIDIALRDAIDRGLLEGPRIIASGRLICMTGGHGWQIGGREADGPDEIMKAAREQVKNGAEWVKFMATGGIITPGVWPGSVQLSVPEMRAGIDEARKAGRMTSAHAQSSEGILNALEAGIDTIEHGYGINNRIIEIIKKKKKAVIPTIKAACDLFESASMGLLPDFMISKLKIMKPGIIKSIKMAVKSGIRIGAGTDAGTPFNYHGHNLREIINLINYGMPVNRAFESATLEAAKILGIDGQTGSIEDGKFADIAVFKGNPMEDLSILEKKEDLVLIMKEGKIVKNAMETKI